MAIYTGFSLTHLFTGLPAAVMAPPGRAEQVEPFLFPAYIVTGKVLADAVPFMKDDVDGVGLFRLFCQPEFYVLILFCRKFGLKGPEKLIPYNKEHAHVLIQVAGVGSVVDPVMGGGHQYVFQPAHFADELCMYKDAPYLGHGIHKEDVQGLKPQVSQWNKVDKTVQRLKDRTPETHCKIHVFGGMMGNVDGPEQADLMVPPVQPVVKKIFCQQQEKPVREHVGNGYPVMPVA